VVAQAAGLSVIGTLGVLLAAKRAGLIDHRRPELDNLVRTSFFLGPQLYARLLREAGEEHREPEN
jgi:predicted nucleic acid-binding protein